jgi:tetratricopeptide (TPR) repeat protein
MTLARYGGLAPVKTGEDAYEPMVARAVLRASEVDTSRQQALALLTSLLVGERSWDDLSGAETATLRGLPQLRALLDAGFALRLHDPQATLRFARLARYAADRLSWKEFGPEPVADLRALAWAELGNAYRICDDLSRASRSLNRAIYWSGRGSRSDLLLGRIADLLASLFGAQQRFPEACELLFMVYEAHLREGRRYLAGRALFSAAVMTSYSGDNANALLLMNRALELVDHRRHPALVAHIMGGMITSLSDLGRHRAARRLLWRCRPLIAEHADAIQLLRLRWLEGRIAVGLGDAARAEPALKEARAGFADHGQVYPAALAGLDLAALWAQQGRVSEIHLLAGEMIATFRAMRIAREAIVTLLILQRACIAGGGQLLEIIDMVVSFLKDLEQQPAKREDPVLPSPSSF